MTMYVADQVPDSRCAAPLPSMACRNRGRSLRWSARQTLLFVASSSTLLWAAIIYTGWLVL